MADEQYFIPTFVFFQKNKDRIINEFREKPEFNICRAILIPEGSENEQHQWDAIHEIIRISIEEDHDVIAIAYEGHQFSEQYHPATFIKSILSGYKKSMGLLLGSAQGGQFRFNADNDIDFIASYGSTEFLLIYRSFYQNILEFPVLGSYATVHETLSALALRKGIISPSISVASISDGVSQTKLTTGAQKNSTIIEKRTERFKNNIYVIIPFRNAKPYLKDCYMSLLAQEYKSFKVIFIDDCSDDDSLNSIPNHPCFIKIRSETRNYVLKNIHQVLTTLDFGDEDIIAIMDGDDYLLHEYALDIVNEIYNQQNCFVSFGQYLFSTGQYGHCYGYNYEEFVNLRQLDWRASHLKTFKFKIYKEFINQDKSLTSYLDENGAFYKAYDVALMVPLLEISGYSKVFFNKEPIYLYRLHDLNESNLDVNLQKNVQKHVNSKQPFLQMA